MIIRNSRVPQWLSIVIDVYAIALWPFIFIRDEGDVTTVNHEKIHLRQQVELLIIGFYFLYAFYWLRSYLKQGDKARAYYDIPFEKEAYMFDGFPEYPEKRRRFNWWHLR